MATLNFAYRNVLGRRLQSSEMDGNNQLYAQAYDTIVSVNASVAATANFKGNWSALTGPLNVPASVRHSGGYWLLLSNLADVTTATPGVSGSWAAINVGDAQGPAGATAGNLAALDATGKILSDSGISPTSIAAALAAKASLSGAMFTGNVDMPSMNGGQLAGMRNVLLNGNFAINQAAPASAADDAYGHDQWYALTQTGAIAPSTVSNAENGTPYMARLTQSQATAQRMGYAQIVEGAACKHLRGKQVTFRFGRTRLAASANVRYAVLEWTGTEDVVTSDVVNDWTSASYTAGGFFLASNITVSGVVQQALAANTLTDGSALTVTLGSSFNNLIVLAWTEGTVAQNVTLDLAHAQLERGPVATPFEQRGPAIELLTCQRHYLRVKPGFNAYFGMGWAASTTSALVPVRFPATMRTAPTALEQSGTASHYGIAYLLSAASGSSVPTFAAAASPDFALVQLTTSGLTAGQGVGLYAANAAAYLGWSARL